MSCKPLFFFPTKSLVMPSSTQPWTQVLEKICPFSLVQCCFKNRCRSLQFTPPTLNGARGDISNTKRPTLHFAFCN